MKSGKVSEAVLKRSILKQITTKSKEVLIGPGLCRDSGVMEFFNENAVALSSNPFVLTGHDGEMIALNTTVNNIVASGAEALGVLINLILPELYEEADIKKNMKNFNTECLKLNLQILGGHTELSDAVNKPIAVITVVGKVNKENLLDIKKVKPGHDIVMSKHVGLEGTYRALIENREILNQRFSNSFLQKIELMKEEISVIPESIVAMEHGVVAMHDASTGGIFKALWEIGSGSGLGIEVNFKDIQIKQETVEITEILDINPYQIKSGGTLLMIGDDGEGLVDKLENKGINASLIGKMTKSNDRVLITQDGKRYLESN